MAWRAIHDDVPYSDSLNSVSDFAERLYWRMLAVSDQCGRGPGSVTKIASLCIPRLPKPVDDLSDAIDELIRAGRISVYIERGICAYQILEFDERQPYLKKDRMSRFPAPPAAESQAATQLALVAYPQQTSVGAVHREEKRGEESKNPLAKNPPEETENDASTKSAASPVRPPGPLWDALVTEFGDAPLTKSERGRWNKAAKELRDVGADASEIAPRARNFRTRYPNATLTPTALTANWSSLAPKRSTLAPCEQCGVGGGLHTSDCPAVAPFTDADIEHVAAQIQEHRA